jgi:hypothetical protein
MKLVKFALAISMALFCLESNAATLLPNGEQSFVDQNGAPYAGGTVCMYVPGTLTAKLTWQNAGQTTANASPCVTLDSAGRAILYGTGAYRQRLIDVFGNLIWDQFTYGLGSSGQVINTVTTSGSIATCSGIFSVYNATSAEIVLSLPASPSIGDSCSFVDASGTAGVYPVKLTAGGNSFVIGGSTFLLNSNGSSISLVWLDVGEWGFSP